MAVTHTITPGNCFIMPDDEQDDVAEAPTMFGEETEEEISWRRQMEQFIAEETSLRHGAPRSAMFYTLSDRTPDLLRNEFKPVDIVPVYEPKKNLRRVTPFQCHVARRVRETGCIQTVANELGMKHDTVRSQLIAYHRNRDIMAGREVERSTEYRKKLKLVDNWQSRARLGARKAA